MDGANKLKYATRNDVELKPAGQPSNSRPPIWTLTSLPRRYLLAVLAFFGCFNIYSMRVTLSVAIIDMTANRTSLHPNGTHYSVREFDWTPTQQGLLLGSFYYGYITTHLLGGRFAPKVGGAKLFGCGVLATALLTLLIPSVARTGFLPLLTLRILQGLLEGVTFPALQSVWSQWAPPFERTKLVSVSSSGIYVGTLVSTAASGLLAQHDGWPSIFYIFGSLTLLWCLIWLTVAKESPEEDCYINDKELRYLTEALGPKQNHQVPAVPWRCLLASLPVWSIIVTYFVGHWGFYTLLNQLPTFLNDVFNLAIGRSGIMASIPYLAVTAVVLVSGQTADLLQSKWRVPTTTVRKASVCTAFLTQAIFMMATAFSSTTWSAVVCLASAVGFGGLAGTALGANSLDIAPQYASIITGISVTFGSLAGILSPTLNGFIIQNKAISEWRIVFFISAGLYLFGCVFYGLFASGERQSWAQPPTDQSKAPV